VIGAPVCQGYGMTETAAAITIAKPGDPKVGHVGPPLSCAEICLEDVDEMNYKHTDKYPRGEVLVRGPLVFKGYFKNEEATKATIDADGWLHTGDVGRFNPNGTLSIIDRKKNMLKLSQGEYIALEKVEAAYKTNFCAQVWVYGNSYHSFLVAIVVPAPGEVVPWLTAKGWWPTGMAVSTSDAFLAEFKKQCDAHAAEIKAEIMDVHFATAAKDKKLSGLEKVKAVGLENELDGTFAGFNMANDCTTPTMKLKRNVLAARYVQQLQAMYTANGEPPKAGDRW